jgi:RNA polymerase sigma-70 factor (ECF subfamily)
MIIPTMASDESFLIQQARRGDAAACSQLFDLNYDAIYRYCYYHVGNVGLAQDICNQVFVRMVDSLDTFAEQSRPLLAWLYTIARCLVASSLDEQYLIQLVQQGDPEACSQIYDRYYDALYRYCYFYIGDVTLAQDLTVQMFVQMVDTLDKFKQDNQPLLARLYLIARRILVGHYRRSGQRIPPSLKETAAIDRGIAQSSLPCLSAENLAVALNQMTEQDRQVILFQFVEDRSCAEVALLMGQSYEMFKPQPHRALASLQCTLSCKP